jgi:hypothetical protein
MTSVEIKLTKVKDTKNFARFQPENNDHLEDFQKGIYIPNSSPLSEAKALKITIEILEE